MVRLDDPPLHLVGRTMIAALREAFAGVARAAPRAVVLHCTGGGANVRELAGLDLSSAREFISSLHDVCAAIRAVDAPVLAAVDGPCLGAHLEIAAVCDLRICSPASRFGMPEVRVGIPSVIDACWLAAICGLGEASRLVFEGDLVDAEEARRIRLVNRVSDAVEADALAWAEKIAAHSPVALARQKAVIRDWTQPWYEHAVLTSIDHFERTFESPEANEAMRAFIEKRAPRF